MAGTASTWLGAGFRWGALRGGKCSAFLMCLGKVWGLQTPQSGNRAGRSRVGPLRAQLWWVCLWVGRCVPEVLVIVSVVVGTLSLACAERGVLCVVCDADVGRLLVLQGILAVAWVFCVEFNTKLVKLFLSCSLFL